MESSVDSSSIKERSHKHCATDSRRWSTKCATTRAPNGMTIKWSRLFLDLLFFCNPTQVQLIRGDPRYKHMSPEEVIGKFVSFELMIKDSKHIVNLEQGATSTPEVQPVAFKTTEEKKDESTQVDSQLTPPSSTTSRWLSSVRAFDKSSNKRRGRTTSPIPKGCATCVVSLVTL
jgi:hypothetical protein